MRIFTTLLYLLLILAGVSFAALNASSIEVNFYLSTVKLPIAVFMILMLGLGMFVGFFIYSIRYWRVKSECRRLRNQLKITEQEIKNLRTIPVTDSYPGFGDH
jgi:putative membrane protein